MPQNYPKPQGAPVAAPPARPAPVVRPMPQTDARVGVYDRRRAKREMSRPIFSRKVSR